MIALIIFYQTSFQLYLAHLIQPILLKRFFRLLYFLFVLTPIFSVKFNHLMCISVEKNLAYQLSYD